MARNLARSLKRQAELPALSQPVLDKFLGMHERFVTAQPGGRRAMVRYLRAPGLDFSGRNLTDADFTGADFQDSRLIKVRLAWASLLCADLRGADLTDADLSKVDLRGVSLRGANLTGANLDGADMRQAVLARVDLPGGFKLFGASAKGSDGPVTFSADFSNCSMQGARLGRAKLRGANFKGAILTGADLKGADLEDANFDGAVLMDVDFDILMKRLTGRRTCSKTGAVLNVYFSSPAELEACTKAGGELVQRADDNEATIRNRLEVYQKQTAPLVEYYQKRGMLKTVAATGEVDDVYARLKKAVGL